MTQEFEIVTPPAAAAGSALKDRLLAVAEIVLCSSVPTQLAIGALLLTAGLGAGGLTVSFVLMLSLADTLVLVVLMVALTRARGERVADLWLGPVSDPQATEPGSRSRLTAASVRRRLWPEVRHGLVLVPLVFAMVVALLSVLRVAAPWLHDVETNPLEELASRSALDAALLAFVAIVAGGVREELQRAFLLRRFERYLGGATVGVVVWSVVFGVLHKDQGWDAAVATGVLGAFWAVVYLRRRSSVAPVVSHAGFNSLEILRVVLTGT